MGVYILHLSTCASKLESISQNVYGILTHTHAKLQTHIFSLYMYITILLLFHGSYLNEKIYND